MTLQEAKFTEKQAMELVDNVTRYFELNKQKAKLEKELREIKPMIEKSVMLKTDGRVEVAGFEVILSEKSSRSISLSKISEEMGEEWVSEVLGDFITQSYYTQLLIKEKK
jgi:hypothetical protein